MASISPYGYDPAMLAAVNAMSSPEDSQPPKVLVSTTPLSKAYIPPKHDCPLVVMPYEIRAHILSYILPCTINSAKKDIIWLRGHTAVLSTCSALYEVGRDIIYGECVFLIDIHLDRINFNCQWLIATDRGKPDYGCNLIPGHRVLHCDHQLVPSRKIDFISQFSPDTRARMKRFLLRVYLVDEYEGMIKFDITKNDLLAMRMVKQVVHFFHEASLRKDDKLNRSVSTRLFGATPLQEEYRRAKEKRGDIF